jgi:hypothetical protein
MVMQKFLNPYDILVEHEDSINQLMRATTMLMQTCELQQQEIQLLQEQVLDLQIEIALNNTHDK